MKIYTKSGDSGQTQIYADKMVRMEKSADVLECYGSLDELNAQIGLLLSGLSECGLDIETDTLLTVQKNLFQIGFAISAKTTITDSDVELLEQTIDGIQSNLPTQTHFILPGGHMSASQAHICRTVARRAERKMVALVQEHPVPDVCLKYLNRLSDYLFVVARQINHLTNRLENQV